MNLTEGLPVVVLCCLMTVPLDAKVDGDEAKEKRDAEARPTLSGKDAHDQEHERLIREGEENLKEIERLLEEAQSSLAQKKTGAPTQDKQKEAVKRMEKLIQELGKGCSQCSSSSASGGQPQGGKPQQKSGSQKKEGQKPAGQRPKMQAQQQKPENLEQQQKNDGKTENDRTHTADTPEMRVKALRKQLELLQARWGVLPPKMVEEMLSSGGKDVPSEYRAIYSRYLKRIGEHHERRAR